VTGKDYGHWDISLVGKFNPNDHLGFVYQITHKQSGKSYIGCKHLWKFKKRKRVKASEWRHYCSSGKYLKPDIEELGKDAFTFTILMLCKNKRDLYYNEEKIQMELGVLESNNYYNAHVGGRRFYRPVSSYDSDFRCVMSDMATGTGNGRYRGSFYITYDNGIEVLIEDKTVSEWCLENGYNKHGLYRLRKGNQKVYQNIIAMEYASERD
jgi:hypothetical protein